MKNRGLSSDNCGMKAAPQDHRVFQRYRVSMTVLVQRISEEDFACSEREKARHSPTASVVVTDISLSGLVFVTSRPHPPGTLVEIQFCLGARVFRIRAVMKRTQILALPGRRSFQCAAQFVRGEAIAEFIPAVAKYLQKRFKSEDISPGGRKP